MSQFTLEKRRILLRVSFPRFWLASLALLAGLLAACSPAAAPAATATNTARPTETVTSTPEPTATATQVVEYPSPDQEWLLNVIFPKVREGGCEPTYEASYDAFELYVNSIVWTVDESGNPVQGLVDLNFCGTNEPVAEGEGRTYLGFYKIGDGRTIDRVERIRENPEIAFLAGPTYVINTVGYILPEAPAALRELLWPIFLPDEQLAFLEDADLLMKMQQQHICMNSLASEELRPLIYTSLYIPIPIEVAEVLGALARWSPGTPLDQCP